MNVLSGFDGMSCGQIALHRARIEVDNYFASEIDKYAIKVTQANFPSTKQLGDIQKVTKAQTGQIDLLIGGSPCQGFSFAGKQLNFDDPRSKLFFEFVRLKEELKPRYFLLENVKMKKESQDIISKCMGCQPVLINSSLVSAQNRQRLYWTNIPFEIPKDKEVMLADILESGFTDREKSYCLDANYFRGGNLKRYFQRSSRQLVFTGAAKRGRYNADGKTTNQQLELRFDGKTNALTTTQKTTLPANLKDLTYRKLTVTECERLQTVPEGYTNHVSNTQRYKMLGNGWTVDVISSIFAGLNNQQEPTA
jgi:DNA-cytosine methyltransferase